MAIEYEDTPQPRRGRIEYEGEPAAPKGYSGTTASSPQAKSLADQIPISDSDREAARLAAQIPPEKRVQPVSPLESALMAMSAIPVLGGGARLAQIGLRGSQRLAPYAARAAEMFIPKTGVELAKRTALTGAGGAAAQAASNLLPEDTNPLTRFGVETATGMAVEGVGGAGRSAFNAFRPILPGGPRRAGERVVREFEPQQIQTLPQVSERSSSVMRRMQESLRGAPKDEAIDVTELSRLLGTEAARTRAGGGALAERLTAGTERRLGEISRPRTSAEIGQEARDIVDARLSALKKARETQVDTNKSQAFSTARSQEVAGRRVNELESFKDAERRLAGMKIDPQTKLPLTTGATGSQIDEVRRELTGVILDPMTGETRKVGVSFQKLEDLRRKLGDRSAGLPAEGFDAIGQQQAGDLKVLVENVMKEFTGGTFDRNTGITTGGLFEKYLADYRKASEPINAFRTSLGQKLTGRSEADFARFVADEQALPKAIFSSPRNVDDFIALTGGDRASVERLARNYVSRELSGATPKQINNFLQTNSAWLAKFPQVRDDFAKFAQKATQETDVQKRLAARTEQRAGRFELGRDPAEQARNFTALIKTGSANDLAAAGRTLAQTPEGADLFKRGVRDILGTENPGSLERVYRDRIRPAMNASGLYKPDELNFVDQSIRDIVQVQNAVNQAMSRASQIPGAETSAAQLTRLINEEVSQMKKGGVMATVIAGALLKGADAIGLPTPSLGYIAGGAGVGAALAKDSYLQYNNRIREAVNDIVTDPVKLREVLATPPAQREGVIGRLIRQTTGVALGVSTPEREEANAVE
jgi:hypothetical protein